MSEAPNLLQLQRQLQARVLYRDDALLMQIAAGPAADATHRSRVYEDAYRLRLIEVLGNDFPVLKAYVGAEVFDALAGGYLADHPSQYFSVRYVGTEFSAWLSGHSADQSAADRHSAELAAFEWAQGQVFDAADSEVVVLGDIAGIPPEAWPGLRLRLQPAIRCIALHGNAAACVAAHGNEAPMPAAMSGSEPVTWLLWRRGFDVYWRVLDPDENAVLRAARDSANFGAICELLCNWHPVDAVALRAASLLKLWISDELIAGLDFENPPTATDETR